jgi:hypothetical protein
MRGFRPEERGVSAAIGFTFIIAITMMALAVYVMEQVPEEWKQAEYNTMQEVESSFLKLRDSISALRPGEATAVGVRMGTLSPTAMVSATTNATLKVASALHISDWRVARYYDAWSDRYRAYDTYVVEGSNLNYQSDNYDNDHLFVSTYVNRRVRTYLKFDFRDVYGLYDEYEGEFEDDAEIHKAHLLLYVKDVDTAAEPSDVMEAAPPTIIEPWLVVNDEWDESITWATQPHNELTDVRLENTDVGDEDEWLDFEGREFDITRVVKEHWNRIRENQVKDRPIQDPYLSFVLREPDPSSLKNRVTFRSRDDRDEGYEFSPRLRVVFWRLERPGRISEGLVDFGYIKYEANNEYLPSQYYIYEGGMVITQRSPGWYETMLAEPLDFITLSDADGNNIRVMVKRYQIKEGSIRGESAAGTGYTSIEVHRKNTENLVDMPSSPNRSEVTIAIRTDHPSVWRDYLERLAAKLNFQMGGEWDQYGDFVKYDYDSVGLTIRGKNLDPDVQDIYYGEQVIWLEVSTGYFAGGRT